MTTLLNIEGNAPVYPERVDVFSTVEIDVRDRSGTGEIAQRVADGAKVIGDGEPLRVDVEYDEARGRLKIDAAGALSSLRLLEHVFEPQTEMASLVQIEPIERVFADSLAAHFVAAAKHHPQGGVPLRFDSEYDAPRRLLRVKFRGSVFAIAYFATIAYLRLTQRLDRQTRHAG